MKEKIIISISPTEDHGKKLRTLREERLKAGYPKIGTVLRAVKDGCTSIEYDEGYITKDKEYVVVDNVDRSQGYYHVQSDDEWYHILLIPDVLREYFGWEMNE